MAAMAVGDEGKEMAVEVKVAEVEVVAEVAVGTVRGEGVRGER